MFIKSLKGKIILPTVIILVALVVILTSYSSYKFSDYNETLLNNDLALTVNSLKHNIESMKNDSMAAAASMASNPSAIKAIKERDTNEILKIFSESLGLLHVDYYTICDETGIVLARTHEPTNFGDSVLGQQNIKDALSGKTASYYEAGSAVKVSVRTGVPVYDTDGTLIGAVSAGVRFDKDEFVDDLKELYQVEATVFSGDTRVATTIIQDGKRVVGTTLNPDIAAKVIDGRQEYFGEADILGTRYKTFYLPLINAKNETFAIIFIGNSTAGITDNIFVFIREGIIIGIIGLVVSVILLIIIVSTISKPIVTLSEDLNNIANGNLGININIKSKDEIGQLGDSLQKMVNILRRLLDDINVAVTEREKGDLDYVLSTEGFSGDFKKLTDNILKLISTSHDDTMNLLNILNEFNNGNFNADLPKQPGKKIIFNQKVDMMRDNMQSLSGEIGQLTSQAISGHLSARADTGMFNGDWKTMVEGLNELLGAITEPIREATDALEEMSKGNLHARIDGDYKGDHAIMKKALNKTAETISSYIDEISRILNELAGSNLNQRVTREYVGDFAEIKDSLNNIFEKLNDVMVGIKSSSGQVAAGAKQVADSSADLAQGASEQALSIDNLNTTVVVMNEKTYKNTENATKAKALSGKTNENAMLGNVEMKKMLSAMDAIRESSHNISKIIKVIDDIAFQTNLLALNAAVEAARAGESGRGFSVVAEEVRSLAMRSQSAASDTTELIENAIRNVNEGYGIAEATAEVLEKIVSDITGVSTIISEISEVSEEQSKAISQINDGVSRISLVVQNNSATSEESASASEELSSQSEVLNNMIKVFKLKG